KVWDARTAGPALATLKGHTEYVSGLVFLADSRTLVSGTVGGRVQFWDVQAEPEQHLRGWTGTLNALAFAPDGTLLAADSQGLARSIDLGAGRVRHVLKRPVAKAAALHTVFSPDGRLVASAGANLPLQVRELATGNELPVPANLPPSHNIGFALAFSADGRFLAIASTAPKQPGRLVIWDPATAKIRTDAPLTGTLVNRLLFAPDGRSLVCGLFDGTALVVVVDVETGKETHRLAAGWALGGWAFSPAGDL